MLILVAIVGISLLIVVHEAGHYVTARAFGMRVLRFSIGFGPSLVRYQPKGSDTVFQIGAIPFLAYVLIAGMNPAEKVDPDDPGLYANKGIFARIATIFAGSFANYLAASIMIFLLGIVSWPSEEPVSPVVVGEVLKSMPAAKAGIKPGDVIVEVNGKRIERFEQLQEATRPRVGQGTKYVVQRQGEIITMSVTPVRNVGGHGMIGVGPRVKRTYVRLPVGDAVINAAILPLKISLLNLAGLAKMMSSGSTEGLTGPLGMGKLVVEQAEKGVADFVWILIVISVALGMLNLLPFPALDGGRLVFLGFELVLKKRPNEKVEALIHSVGLLFLLGLMVMVTVQDCGRYF